jgi:hypothetical protein
MATNHEEDKIASIKKDLSSMIIFIFKEKLPRMSQSEAFLQVGKTSSLNMNHQIASRSLA